MEQRDRHVERIARRAVWSEADGQRVAAAWRRSGETIAAFARGYGFPPHRLYYWRDRNPARTAEIGREGRGVSESVRSSARFHPVRVVAERGEVGAGGEQRAGDVIEIRVIRIPRGMPREELDAVLAAFGPRADASVRR